MNKSKTSGTFDYSSRALTLRGRKWPKLRTNEQSQSRDILTWTAWSRRIFVRWLMCGVRAYAHTASRVLCCAKPPPPGRPEAWRRPLRSPTRERSFCFECSLLRYEGMHVIIWHRKISKWGIGCHGDYQIKLIVLLHVRLILGWSIQNS